MKSSIWTLFLLSISLQAVRAQQLDLTYYLPDVAYNKSIPTPQKVLGYMPGEWHVTHDQLVAYMQLLAAASDRITIEETGRTYENRPLLLLTITSPENHRKLEALRREHLSLTDPQAAQKLRTDKMPVVVYQGFSIHGNEPSGSNAALLVAYYLAAAKTNAVESLLDQAIILFDPSFNPDGLQRFSTWANMHKSQTLVSDPQSREFHEVWPRGRTNHYWFDLNRDWLPVQLPESQARIRTFHRWKPNVLTDHHEMGSHATFFFQPGVPQRTNPLTPARNQELTAAIARYHAEALNEIGSLYYSEENYDDFYYGKGSTYPDINGGIGILFEQASSRGHLQETDNGLLAFPFAIRNQVRTALSTLKAAYELRQELLDYQRDFFAQAAKEGQADPRKAFVVGSPDRSRLNAFYEVLQRHHIDAYRLSRPLSVNGLLFEPDHALLIPLAQRQYRLIRAMFDTSTQFADSIFYDISAWTFPYAFGLDWADLADHWDPSLQGQPITPERIRPLPTPPARTDYAYLMDWTDYYSPAAAYELLDKGLRIKVATQPFTMNGKDWPAGTLLIPVANQDVPAAQVQAWVTQTAQRTQVAFTAVQSSYTKSGIDLGSRKFMSVSKPRIAILAGNGVSSYEVGEVWHLLDTRYHMPATLLDVSYWQRYDLSRYNVIVMPHGSWSALGEAAARKLEAWLEDGGVLIAWKGALRWLNQRDLADLNFIETGKPDYLKQRRPYGKLEADRGGQVIGGAIFEADADLTHPLLFGYIQKRIALFRNHNFMLHLPENPWAAPLVYTNRPLLAGYISSHNLKKLSGSAAAIICGQGKGRIIALADNPCFRAFWYGTNKLFANGIFFGNIIHAQAVER